MLRSLPPSWGVRTQAARADGIVKDCGDLLPGYVERVPEGGIPASPGAVACGGGAGLVTATEGTL
jgi:hypothetical protein